MIMDESTDRLFSVSGHGGSVQLYCKPANESEGPREAVSTLSLQGVTNPCGLFFGKDRALYTLDRDEEGRLTSLIRLSLDGIVKGRTQLSCPLHVASPIATP